MYHRFAACCMAFFICINPSIGLAKEKKAPELSKQEERLYSLTPEDFAGTVEIKDDSMENFATFSTVNGFQWRNDLLKIVSNDLFFRSFVDKSDGSTTFQIYINTFETAGAWPGFQMANYLIPDGQLTSVKLDVIWSDVSCDGDGSCVFNEAVAFTISEQEIRTLADAYAPGGRVKMQIRLKGQRDISRDWYLTAAEAAGLLKKVDAYRARRQNQWDKQGH